MKDLATILAVDDTSESLAFLVSLLTGAGYRVLPADSGELALAAVSVQPPDLILLDIRMPGIDGLEVLRRLGAGEETRRIPVILVSAFSDVKDWVEGLRLGASDYVTKPFQPEELLRRVEAHLALSQARLSLERQAAELREANEQLRAEVERRQVVEGELRASLDRAGRSRRALLGAFEDLEQSRRQTDVRASQQAVIAELGQVALTGAGLAALMDETVIRVARTLDVEMCEVLELRPDASGALLRAGVGWQDGRVGRATVGTGLSSQSGFTLHGWEPVVVEDLRTETRFHASPLLLDHGVVSGLSTVIGDPDRPYGVLGAHTTRPRAFSGDDVHFLQAAANLLASAVKHAEHEAEIGRLNRLWATLSQVNQAIVRCTSQEVLFRELCRVVVEFGRFTGAWVALKAGEGGEVTAVARHAASPDEDVTVSERARACGVAAEAVRTGLLSIATDAPGDERTAGCEAVLSSPGIRACAAFPIRLKGEVAGAFALCTEDAGLFGSDEVRLLEEVAVDISIALDHLAEEGRRREAEEALRRERDRAQRFLDTVETIIVALDPEGRITSVNRKGCELLGRSEDELLGQPWFSTCLPRPEGTDTVYPHFQRLIEGELEGVEYFENDIVSRSGELRQVAWHNALLRDEDGRITGTLSSGADISEQRRLAAESARLENELRQAQKVEAIGRLAGGVAHDFNNLTAIVLGYGKMLLGRLGPEDPARRWAEQIVSAGQRSAALTRQLLAFGRKQTLSPVVLDLGSLLRNLETMLGRLIGEDIQLELDLAADLGRVLADPGQIEQVVTNIVLNARDAMPLGGRLTVETANVELDETYVAMHPGAVPGRYVRLALTDTGCGMDEATLARVFEPFFTTKERGKGTGLGMATAFGIVKQSGGQIRLYSEPGKGTVVRIYLPRTDAEAEEAADVTDTEIPRSEGELILLVEDEAPLRELCEVTLSRLGYQVRAAGSGREALVLVEEERLEPDLVLTDVIMPGMSGAELAERLRRKRPGLSVLYMSGYPDDIIARHGVLDPEMHFIQKPFTERALATEVRAALGTGAEAARKGCRVLMIDDDEVFCDLVRLFCARQGHGLVGVGSSAAALQALATQTFDVLLVDLNIPGTDGERVLSEIRAAGHAAPAIILTGDVASADMDVLRPLGASLALEKSCDAGPVLKAIEEATRGQTPLGAPPGKRVT